MAISFIRAHCVSVNAEILSRSYTLRSWNTPSKVIKLFQEPVSEARMPEVEAQSIASLPPTDMYK